MGSSNDSAPNPAALSMGASPNPDIPIAGKGGGTDPYSYGQFQNFLPDATGAGPAQSATGLRPDMFDFKPPGGAMPGGGQDPNAMRNTLAGLQKAPLNFINMLTGGKLREKYGDNYGGNFGGGGGTPGRQP